MSLQLSQQYSVYMYVRIMRQLLVNFFNIQNKITLFQSKSLSLLFIIIPYAIEYLKLSKYCKILIAKLSLIFLLLLSLASDNQFSGPKFYKISLFQSLHVIGFIQYVTFQLGLLHLLTFTSSHGVANDRYLSFLFHYLCIHC